MSAPCFAIVGPMNKGKSSIVATLSEDSGVAISPRPGTTVRSGDYPMRLDGRVLYTIIDTPGFSRPQAALRWLRAQNVGVDRRRAAVEALVKTQAEAMPEEHQLLRPLIEKDAAILYVVDGSVPYGEEYEAGMEILRWTGQPRMALINPIESAEYVEEWRAVLGQYFQTVRIFNPMTADFNKRVQLLADFGALREEWRPRLEEAAGALRADRKRRQEDAARILAEMLAAMHTEVVEEDIGRDGDVEATRRRIGDVFRERLRQHERAARAQIERLYGHGDLQRREQAPGDPEEDLFSRRSFYLFRMSRWQLAAVGAASGALVGGTIDAMVGGATFLAGTLIGGLASGVLTLISADRLAEYTKIGGTRLRFGPLRGIQFTSVALGRALRHHGLVDRRTHAQRQPLAVEEGGAIRALSIEKLRRLQSLMDTLRTERRARADVVRDLAVLLSGLLEQAPG